MPIKQNPCKICKCSMSQHDLRPQHSGNRGYLWTPTASKALPSHLFDWHILFGFSLYLTLVGSPGCSCTWHLPFGDQQTSANGWLKRSKCFKHQQELSPSLRQSDCCRQVLVTRTGYVQSTPAFINQWSTPGSLLRLRCFQTHKSTYLPPLQQRATCLFKQPVEE